MFTVLSKNRNSDLFLIGALAIAVVALLTLTVAPAISAPQADPAPAPRLSEVGSDYYQRHPELSTSANTPLDECVDVSIGELAACRLAGQTPVLTPGQACESPVDCR